MSAVAIDNAGLPPICPSGATSSAPSSDDGFRKALTSETDKTASEPVPSERGADDAKPAATDQQTSPKNAASDQRDSQGRDAVATNGSATEPAIADAGQAPAQPAVAQEDAAALLVILAQLMAAQTPAQPQMSAAGKAGVTTTKTAAAAAATATAVASPSKDSKNKATDQTPESADSKSKSEPDAAQVFVAPVAAPVQLAAPAAVAVTPPTQPAADAPKSAASASAPDLTAVSENKTAPSAQDLLTAVDLSQSGSADPQPSQVPSPNPADDFAAQIPAADRPHDDSPRATATDTNAAAPMPQVQRNDAPPPMEHLRVETRPFAAEPALQQLAVHVTRAVKDGLDQFDIDLKPDTLGRVTVRLEFGSESKVHAVFAAERPETLNLLRRDVHEIARAFNDAGVRADAGSLSFSLNGNGGQSDRQVFTGQPILFPATDSATEAATMTVPATYSRAGGIDIRI